jgi:SNF2 family DNA or RNA helicase
MLKLSLKHGILSIDATTVPSILIGAHRSFFELACGFERDITHNSYHLVNPAAIDEVLVDTLDYLKDDGVPFEVDHEIELKLTRLQADKESFLIAADKGLQIKSAEKLYAFEIPNFTRTLKPYQLRSVYHLLNVLNGANFSVPGSGKTTIIYATLAVLREKNIVDKLVVIGPLSSFMPWEDEYFDCFGKRPRSIRLTGAKHDRQLKYEAAEDYDVFLCSYQTASNDVEELIEFCRKQRVFLVLDESHNVKRFEGGVRAEAVLNIAQFAVRRAILSGTPVPNRYEDLWSQMTFLWPGKQMLGTREQYAQWVRWTPLSRHQKSYS